MTTNTTAKRAPTHRLYAVNGEGDTVRWLEIGAAWRNRDSQGFSLQLDAVRTGGRIVMREIAEREGGQS